MESQQDGASTTQGTRISARGRDIMEKTLIMRVHAMPGSRIGEEKETIVEEDVRLIKKLIQSLPCDKAKESTSRQREKTVKKMKKE